MTNEVVERQKNMISQKIQAKKYHIKSLRRTKSSIEDSILTVAEGMRKSFEKKREECDQEIKNNEKEIIELESELDSVKLQTEVLKVFENPVKIWKDGNSETKNLLLKVMFDGVLKKQRSSNPCFSLTLAGYAWLVTI